MSCECCCCCICLDCIADELQWRTRRYARRLKSYLPLIVPTVLIIVMVISFIWLFSVAGNALLKQYAMMKESEHNNVASNEYLINDQIYTGSSNEDRKCCKTVTYSMCPNDDEVSLSRRQSVIVYCNPDVRIFKGSSKVGMERLNRWVHTEVHHYWCCCTRGFITDDYGLLERKGTVFTVLLCAFILFVPLGDPKECCDSNDVVIYLRCICCIHRIFYRLACQFISTISQLIYTLLNLCNEMQEVSTLDTVNNVKPQPICKRLINSSTENPAVLTKSSNKPPDTKKIPESKNLPESKKSTGFWSKLKKKQ